MTMLENSPATGSLLAAIFSDETFIPAEPGSIEETGLSPDAGGGLDLQVRAGRGIGQRAADRGADLPAVWHVGRPLPRAPPAADHRAFLVGADERLLLRPDGPGSPVRSATDGNLCVRGARPGAVGGLHRVGRSPDDSCRGPQAATPGQGLRGHFGGSRAARPVGTGDQLGCRPVPVRCARQRQDDAWRPASRCVSARTSGFRRR